MPAEPYSGRREAVTARAHQPGPQRWTSRASANIANPIAVSFFAAIAIVAPSASSAQIGAVASVFSDDRLRGYSVSDGHPVGILDLSFDSTTGIYGAASGTAVASSSGGVRPLAFQLNAGYAKRFSADLTAEFGIIHSHYLHHYGYEPIRSYTEVYAGLSGELLSSRIYYSPHYFEGDGATIYGEANAASGGYSGFRIVGHAGLLVPLSRGDGGANSPSQFDWSLGVSRTLGRIGLHAAWTGHSRAHFSYRSYRASNALVLGASYIL